MLALALLVGCSGDDRGRADSAVDAVDAGLGRLEMVEPALRDGRYDDARCNDGTPFGFDLHRADPPSSNWVVYLQGGKFCDDQAYRCDERDADLMTTPTRHDDGETWDPDLQGLFSLDPDVNPTFYDANWAIAEY